MNLLIISKVCEEVFYNGRVMADKGLKMRDFLQIGKMAKGYILTGKYWANKDDFAAVLDLYPSMLKRVTVKVERHKSKQPFICLPEPVLNLPHGYGVYSVIPFEHDDEQELTPYFRNEPGAGWLYSDDELGVTLFEVVGDKVNFKGIPSCIKNVEVTLVPADMDEKQEIPMDVAYEVLNYILGVVLKVKGFPIDMKNDGDPNVTLVKDKLSSPQT